MLVTKRSLWSGKEQSMEIPTTAEELEAYANGDADIQAVLGHLSAEHREFILTGLTPEEWAEMQAEAPADAGRPVEEITAEKIASYAGGQLEVQLPGEYLFRGAIAAAELRGRAIHVRLAWTARAEGYPLALRWVADERTEYVIEPAVAVGEIGDGRLMFGNVVGEVAVFFPPGGSQLERSTVAEK